MIQQEIKQNKFCVFLRIILRSSAITSLFFIWVGVANGAQLNLSSQSHEIAVGQQFQVDLFLNTENEEINAIEGKIIFPEKILELKEIRDGNSIVNFWIERPKIGQTGVVSFSGIIPGGYQEAKGFVFSVIFQAKANGSGVIKIGEAKVLLNDGKGTQAPLSISNFQFSISKQFPISNLPIPESQIDTDPPEEFKPEIISSPDIFNGKWFLVFATQDKGSGIDHYEVMEAARFGSFKSLFSKNTWILAKSPYLLRDQALKSIILVKAVDKVGNERVATIKPRYALLWYENYLAWLIIIIIVLVLAFVIKKI